MTEILGIFFSLLIFLSFSLFPLNIKSYEKLLSTKINYTYDFLFLNLLINFLILFLISFTGLNYFYYFLFVIFLSLISNVVFYLNFSNFKLKIFKNLNFLFFLLFNLLLFIFLSKDPALSWDGLENWYYKAQSFFYNYSFFDLKVSKGVDYYPHFGTFIWGFFWKNSLLQHEYSGRLIYIFIFLLSIFSICDLIKNNNLKIITITGLVLICFDNFLLKGYQEILIFSFMIFALKNFFYYLQNQKKIFLIISFICFNFLPWFKNEGYIFVIIFCLSLLLLIKQHPKKNEILLFVLFSILMLIIKHLLFFSYHEINLVHGGNFNIPSLIEIILFIKLFTVGLIVALFKYKIWFFIFFSFYIFSSKNKIFKKYRNLINLLKVNLILFFILVFVIYFSVINHDYGLSWWIDNSLDRIIYQISGLFIIAVIISINNIKIKV